MLIASPGDCFLLHAIGLEYVKINELEKALASFKKVIETNPEYVGTYYHLAKTFEKMGNNEEAVSTYEAGVKVAAKLNDMHARNELQMALDDLIDE